MRFYYSTISVWLISDLSNYTSVSHESPRPIPGGCPFVTKSNGQVSGKVRRLSQKIGAHNFNEQLLCVLQTYAHKYNN